MAGIARRAWPVDPPEQRESGGLPLARPAQQIGVALAYPVENAEGEDLIGAGSQDRERRSRRERAGG